MIQHPKPWWFRFAQTLFPERCREIPEAQNPDRIVLRQVALWKRHLYLQQFSSGEDPRYMHSHQWHRTFALGLWGGYTEVRMAGPAKERRAPYFYTMGADVIHHVQFPSPGHTSLFLGLWRDDDLKHYYGTPRNHTQPGTGDGSPITVRRVWSAHVLQMVARI